MKELTQLSLHDSFINSININPSIKCIVLELDYLTDIFRELERENEGYKPIYRKATLTLTEYTRMNLDIKGDINREVILNMQVKLDDNITEGLIHLKIYTTSDSLIEVACNGYSFSEKV